MLTIVFSTIFKSTRGDYAVFILIGILSFTIFQETVSYSLDAISNNISIIKQQPVPKILFIISCLLIAVFNFTLSLIPLFLVMIVTGASLSFYALYTPIIILPILFFSLGSAIIISALNVFFDDTRHLTELAVTGLYFLCPVLYPREHIPPDVIKYLELNPLFNQIDFVRDIFLNSKLPDIGSFSINLLVSVVFFFFALWFFKRNEERFIYHV